MAFTYELSPKDDPPQQFLCLCETCGLEWEANIGDAFDIDDNGHGVYHKPSSCPQCESEEISVDWE